MLILRPHRGEDGWPKRRRLREWDSVEGGGHCRVVTPLPTLLTLKKPKTPILLRTRVDVILESALGTPSSENDLDMQ